MKNDKKDLVDLTANTFVESGFRPSKLDEQLIADFEEIMLRCFFLESASAFLGISRQSMYNWRKRGQREVRRMAEEETSLCRASELLYVKFYHAYTRAMATSEIRATSAVMQAGQVAWQAAAWQLERRFPERYGTQKREIKELAKVSAEHVEIIANLRDQINALIEKLQVKPKKGCK